MNTNNNNDANNNNDTLERQRGVFDSLDLLIEREKKQTQDLYEIQDDLDKIQREIHQMEIDKLNRQHDEEIHGITDAVEEFVDKNFFASDEELEQLRALITRK